MPKEISGIFLLMLTDINPNEINNKNYLLTCNPIKKNIKWSGRK
jgi:hypothetical protein